ncbi:CENPA [Symbiodinium sp. CCMP2456]|nr:CENPA [Symbiodinium sp. CCMP2456]
MLANLPRSSRGDHAKRDACRVVAQHFASKVRPFARLAKDVLAGIQQGSERPVRLTEESLTVLQAGMESAVSRHFNDGARCMLHANRTTMFPSDLRLAASVRSDYGAGGQQAEQHLQKRVGSDIESREIERSRAQLGAGSEATVHCDLVVVGGMQVCRGCTKHVSRLKEPLSTMVSTPSL